MNTKLGKAVWAERGQSVSGTAWVAPGEGSTWRELFVAFSPSSNWKLLKKYSAIQGDDEPGASRRTNLKLTGAPLTEYDRERWESGNVE